MNRNFFNSMLESSSGRQTQTATNSLALEDQILDFKPRSSHPGPILINRKKTLQSLMKENLKEISSITFMDFTEIPDLTDKDLEEFFDWIRRLHNLRELSINLSQDDGFFWGVRDILRNLKGSLKRIGPTPNLTSLKVNLSKCQEIPRDIFQEFVRKFPCLSKLSVNLSSCEQLEEDLLLSLAKSIRCLSCLKELSLRFSNTWLKNTGILALISSLKFSRILRYLKLDFYGSHGFDTGGIERLSKALDNLEHLQDLSLDLRRCTQINNHEVKNLVSTLSKLRSLSRLFLSLGNVGLLDLEILQIVMGNKGGFNQLIQLSLKLPSRSHSLEESEDFERSFVPLANLSVLELFIGDSQWIKEAIWEGLTTLTKLSSLCLHFTGVSKSINQVLRSLGGILRRLTLKEFELNFRVGHQRIKASTWKIFFDGIDTLESLNKLALNRINSNGIQLLGRSLKHIKGLMDFTLGKYSSFGFGHTNLESIGLLLRKQKNLNAVKFDFLGDDQLKSKDLREVFAGLSLTKIRLKLSHKLLSHCGNQDGPISYLRGILSLRYLELEGSRCDESDLLALSVQLYQLSQVISIILRFKVGNSISPQTKLIFCKNIRELKDLKEFHLYIQENLLPVSVDNFYRISWGMKDIYAGYKNDEINHYQRELKRYRRQNRKACWISFFIAFLILSIFLGGWAVLLVFAYKDMETEQRRLELGE